MYAVIIQSAPNATDPRQTVVAVDPTSGEVSAWTRASSGRGSAGAWLAGLPVETVPGERILGEPVATVLTDKELEEIRAGVKPGVLLQRIQRKPGVDGATVNPDASKTVESVIDMVVGMAQTDPASLAVFAGKEVAGSATVTRQVETVGAYMPPVAPVAERIAPVTPIPAAQPTSGRSLDNVLHPELRVPTLADVNGYIDRTIHGVSFVDILDDCMEMKQSVSILGHAGVGKTSQVEYYSAMRSLPLVVINCNPMLTEDALQGAWQPSGVGEQLVWRNSELAEAVDATRNPRGAVVLLNEANRMSPLVSSFFMTMLAERRLPMTAFSGQSIPIPDNVLFVMDANPGYRGTKAMDEAYVDRFLYKVTFDYDRAIEARFVPSNTLLDIAFEYREQMANGMFDTPFSTRMLKAFVQTARSSRRNIQHALASLLETFPIGEERETIRMRLDVALPTIADELGVPYVA